MFVFWICNEILFCFVATWFGYVVNHRFFPKLKIQRIVSIFCIFFDFWKIYIFIFYCLFYFLFGFSAILSFPCILIALFMSPAHFFHYPNLARIFTSGIQFSIVFSSLYAPEECGQIDILSRIIYSNQLFSY